MIIVLLAAHPVQSHPVTAGEAEAIARQAFIYGFGPMLLESHRQAQIHHFSVANRMVCSASPGLEDDAKKRPIMLYWTACLDLAREPVVLCSRDKPGVTVVLQMVDSYGNIQPLPAAGRGVAGRRCIAMTAPGWKGKVPGELREIRCTTRGGWIFARTFDQGERNNESQGGEARLLSLDPLSLFARGKARSSEVVDEEGRGPVSPVRQVLLMDMQAFFGRLALFMKRNPAPASDSSMMIGMARIGVDASSGVFDTSALSPSARRAIEQGMKKGMDDIREYAHNGLARTGPWVSVSSAPDHGRNYLRRSAMLYAGFGEPLTQGFTLTFCTEDGSGRKLDGNANYVVRFKRDSEFLDTACWSLSLVGADFLPMPRRLQHVTLTSRDRLAINPDGSLEIHIQAESPGPERESNWLSTAGGAFTLVLKVLQTNGQVPAGGFPVPEVKRMGE